MAQADTLPSDSPPLSPTARFLWAALILATLYLCYFHNLGALGLVGPDEPRYAWIARDMAESGDWVTPRLYGQPWFEKPPLYYWGAALSFKLFGVSEAAARLPSAVCALLATLALAWLALRIYGAETARWLLVLLPTTVGMIGFSHAAATDMPFTAMLTIAMVFAAILLNLLPASIPPDPRSTFLCLTSISSLLFGFFLGLATLAKGPAAIILSGGAVLLWAVVTKRWRDAFRCLHPFTMLTFCLTSLPWYILCARRNPDFFRVFIIEHNFRRFLTPEFQHIQPFWFYVPILLAATLPWTLVFLASGLSAGIQAARQRSLSPQTIYLACWALFPILFFSISKSKLPGYILPAIPVSLITTAAVLSSAKDPDRRAVRVSLFLGAGMAVLAVLLFSGVGNFVPERYQDLQATLEFVSVAIFLTFVLILLSAESKRSQILKTILLSLAFLSFLFLVYLGGSKDTLQHVLPADISARNLARAIQQTGANSSNLWLVNVRRSTHYQLNFYLHTDLQELNGQPEPGQLLLGERISCTGVNESCRNLFLARDKSDDWQLIQVLKPHAPGSVSDLRGYLGGGSGDSLRGDHR